MVAELTKAEKAAERRVLLQNLAQVLNSCNDAKLMIKMKHGIVCSKIGYVLPVGDEWVVRTRAYTPFEDDDSFDEDDDLA